ncbi:antigen WC1.1-like [Silurus meridionalis]|uniref:antigen WC1.1-like n=1 Tax=Silurus meridionalis TaxID=175797 RepID=UPI001EEBCC72|nr:antigen WC1.1-like [Silurus meridionalis]
MAFHEGRVRLSGGSECQGEVEIYFRQDWRKVLLDSWSLSEASVLCRQLGCGSVLNYRSSPSTTEHKHMCVTAFSCSGSEAHLGNCSSAQAVNCTSGEHLYITCSAPSSIRLVGSGGDCAGRLEVFHSGSWGTVCDDSWGIEDADVVCRQLQCGRALSTHTPAWFGPGTGSIWLNEVECEGNETSLWNCRFQLCEEGECGHQEDVGVVCSEFKEIRLTGGCEGNLEVFYNGTWGNVCYNQMDDETADMVCRELNCGKRERLTSSRARVESAPNWLDHVKCRKHDSNLFKCPSSPWGQNRCDNRDEVVHITCKSDETSLHPRGTHGSKHWSLRLSGGKGSCSGRLEVYHNATWGSVCDDQWNISNAQVVCRQLGCGSVLSADRFVPGEGTVWLNRVKCRGDEIHLWDCHHSLKKHTDCSHAGVTCADVSASTTSTTKSTTISTTTARRTGTSTVAPSTLHWFSLLVSKRRRKTQPEAVYEEINHRYITRRITSSTQRGSLLSEEQYSGYEHVDDELLSVKSGIGEKAEDYDDVIDTSDFISATGRVEAPEDYDDAVTAGPIPDNVDEDEAENYDDAITADQKSVLLTEDVCENYDDAVTAETNPNIITARPTQHMDIGATGVPVYNRKTLKELRNNPNNTINDDLRQKLRDLCVLRELGLQTSASPAEDGRRRGNRKRCARKQKRGKRVVLFTQTSGAHTGRSPDPISVCPWHGQRYILPLTGVCA